MPSPRLTVSRSRAGELQLFLNVEARDRLISALQSLSPTRDHFHLQSVEDNDLLQLSTTPYVDGDEVFSAVKVLLRLDEWDKKYFPHVMADGEDEATA